MNSGWKKLNGFAIFLYFLRLTQSVSGKKRVIYHSNGMSDFHEIWWKIFRISTHKGNLLIEFWAVLGPPYRGFFSGWVPRYFFFFFFLLWTVLEKLFFQRIIYLLWITIPNRGIFQQDRDFGIQKRRILCKTSVKHDRTGLKQIFVLKSNDPEILPDPFSCQVQIHKQYLFNLFCFLLFFVFLALLLTMGVMSCVTQ